MEPNRKVLLGMSGGVDSSVSAILLLKAGYEVIGAFMKNWSGDVNGPRCADEENVGSEFQECGWKQERRDAARVAAQLGIPFSTLDFEVDYRRNVVEPMFAEFESGRTPNPDVMCNKYIKFDRFVKEADRLGCAFVATGHYARVQDGKIQKGLDQNKDQSYFLWAIDPAILPRVLFPVGDLTKPEVRAIAREAGLPVAEKKDSTGICFVGEVEMSSFLKARIPEDPGNIVTVDGAIVGKHSGVNFYTIGQRHGLNIGGGDPYYVVEKRPETKELVVSSNFHPALFSEDLTATTLNWFEDVQAPRHCEARIRYRQPVQSCEIISKNADRVTVRFKEPQRAVTPGQSIVFYDGEVMLGGGIIV
ncbi:MAG: tRNA 2-thiouridine(34) synthase MnmA [Patescibacteria group bacterium]